MVAQRDNHRMAVTDGLTGLANRARLHEVLATALHRSPRPGQLTAVLLTDLNGFKQVNDTLGHAAGDRLLIAYGEMLCRSVRAGDLAARLGGDEFAIVLQQVGSAADAEAVARRIVRETETPVLVGDTPIRISGSIGIALSAPGDLDPDELLRRADQAMYEAKRAKDGTWHSYPDPALAPR
jgi:diguanylate cyclase (GGDEF)-like protein